jgi:hypothetical protein
MANTTLTDPSSPSSQVTSGQFTTFEHYSGVIRQMSPWKVSHAHIILVDANKNTFLNLEILSQMEVELQ